jgi:hypothetical protein
MNDAARAQADVTALPGSSPLYQVRGVSTTIHQELRSQLEAAMAFADYCIFLRAGAGSAHAVQLVDSAQALYDATIEALRRNGPPA